MILHIKCAENILINKSHIESLSQFPGSQLIIWYHFKSVALRAGQENNRPGISNRQ